MLDDDECDRDRSQTEQGPFREAAVLVLRLFTVADIVAYDVAFCLGYYASVLLRSILLCLVIVVTNEERIVICYLQSRKEPRLCLAWPGVNDLDHLIEPHRGGTDVGYAAKDRRNTRSREQNPKVCHIHVCHLTKQCQQ
jgi:hypothetical protein